MSIFSTVSTQKSVQNIKWNEIDFNQITFTAPSFKEKKNSIPANFSVDIKYKNGPFRVEFPKVIAPFGVQITKPDEEKKDALPQYTMCLFFQGDSHRILPEFVSKKLTEDDIAREFGEIDPDVSTPLQELREKIIEYVKSIKDGLGQIGPTYKPSKTNPSDVIDGDIERKCKNVAVPVLRKNAQKEVIDEPPYCKYYKIKNYTFTDKDTKKESKVEAKFQIASKGGKVFSFEELRGCKLYIRPVIEFRGLFISSQNISLQSQITSGLIYDIERNKFSESQEDTLERDMEDESLQRSLEEKLAAFSLGGSGSGIHRPRSPEGEITTGESSPRAGGSSLREKFGSKEME